MNQPKTLPLGTLPLGMNCPKTLPFGTLPLGMNETKTLLFGTLHWEWMSQRRYHLEHYTGKEWTKDFTIWNPTSMNEWAKDFTITIATIWTLPLGINEPKISPFVTLHWEWMRQRFYHLEPYQCEWMSQRLYHLEPYHLEWMSQTLPFRTLSLGMNYPKTLPFGTYTRNELSKDFTIWNPTTENELSKDFTIWSTTTGNSQVLITHHGLDLERLLLHVPLLKELAGHKFCHLPQIEQCTSTDVLGCQAPNQLQPIRTPQIIFCVESLNSGAHVKPTS